MVEREKREPRSCVGFSKLVLIGGTSGNALRTAGGEEGSIGTVACFRSFEFGVPRGSTLGNIMEEGGPARTLILFTR